MWKRYLICSHGSEIGIGSTKRIESHLRKLSNVAMCLHGVCSPDTVLAKLIESRLGFLCWLAFVSGPPEIIPLQPLFMQTAKLPS